MQYTAILEYIFDPGRLIALPVVYYYRLSNWIYGCPELRLDANSWLSAA